LNEHKKTSKQNKQILTSSSHWIKECARNAQNSPETLFPFHPIPKTKTGAGVIGPCSSHFKKLPQHIQSRATPEQGNTYTKLYMPEQGNTSRAGQYIH